MFQQRRYSVELVNVQLVDNHVELPSVTSMLVLSKGREQDKEIIRTCHASPSLSHVVTKMISIRAKAKYLNVLFLLLLEQWNRRVQWIEKMFTLFSSGSRSFTRENRMQRVMRGRLELG